MKTLILSLALAFFVGASYAADERTTTTEKTTTTTTTGTGTITEYTPGSTFVVKESSGPVTYHYGKKVVYVTKSGKTIPDEEVRTRIKIGSPVSVHYTRDGENRVISRVVIDD